MKNTYFYIFVNVVFLNVCQLLAQNFQISGGNEHSVMICANSRVFAWGNNKASSSSGTTIYGQLGTSNTTDANLLTPTEVLFPAGLSIRQVDAGSGGHNVALDCNKTVWAWGNNQSGQCGVAASLAVTTPVKVPTGLQGDASGFLTNVIYVSGGNDENYAILNTKELVAWGQNDVGQLGNGTTNASTPTPVYVLTSAGTRLKNVLKVEAGDETGYALVDPDGDGIGTIYSWGGNGGMQLGRPATNQTYAQPVVMADGVTPLSNIVDISAGDVMCLALDALGNVWCWGNGGWGGLTGTNAAFNEGHLDPRKVVGGETGLPYLNATKIAAGQGFCMAVTNDGKAVAWGNNNSTSGSGGSLGDCRSTTNSIIPVYMKTNSTTIVTNVSEISDGDTWGFLIKTDGTFWTWGYNGNGQLGIGNTTNQSCVTQFTPATGCSLPDLKPSANLTGGIVGCPPFNQTLDANFPATSGYTFKWYKDGVLLSSTSNKLTGVSATGKYVVEINYTGPNAPCGGYPAAKDSVVIAEFVPTFTIPNPQTGCSIGNITPYVNGTGMYKWYTSLTGGTLLDTSYTNGTAVIPYSSVTNVSGGAYTVYVEESNNSIGKVAKLADGITSSTTYDLADRDLRIVVYEDIILDSLKFKWKHTTYSTNAFTVGINFYDEKTNCGGSGKAADRTKLLITGPSVALKDKADGLVEEVKVNTGGITLTGSAAGKIYWMGFSTLSGFPGGAGLNVMTGSAFPYKDDVTGNIVNVLGSDNGDCAAGATEYGVHYDLAFRTPVKSCKRYAVIVTPACPTPNDFISFDIKNYTNQITLNWYYNTQSEYYEYEIFKSSDGINFNSIGKTFFTTSNQNTYIDYELIEGKTYYYIQARSKNEETNSQIKYIIHNTSTNEISISPNPNNGNFTINNLPNENCKITLTDLSGKEIKTSNIYNEEKKLILVNLSEINTGIYFIRLQTENNIQLQKIIIE